MDAVKAHLKEKVRESLRDLIEQALATVDEEMVVALLREELHQLTGEPEREEVQEVEEVVSCDVEAQWYGGDKRLEITYGGPGCYARARQELLDDRAMMLELDQVPALMETVTIDVKIGDQGEALAMQGRVVHVQGKEVALEIFSLQGELQRSFKESLDPEGESEASDQERGVQKSVRESSEAKEASVPVVDRLVDLEEASPLEELVFDGDRRAALLIDVSNGQAYRLLEVEREGATFHYIFHRHTLIGVRREPSLDSEALIIDKLQEMGAINGEDRERAGVLATLHGISLQDAMIDIGAIDVEELLGAIEACLADHLRDLWQMEPGKRGQLYELEGRPPLRLRRASIPLIAFTVEALIQNSEALSEHELEAFKERCKGQQVCYEPPPPLQDSSGVFGEPYKRFVEVILAEERNLSELDRITKFNPTRCLRVLWVLDRLEALSLRAQKVELPEHSQIRGLYQGLAEKTPFQILELHWSAYDEAVEKAYRRMMERLQVPREVRRDMSEELEAIEEAVKEAYQSLKDRRRRKKLRQSITDRLQRQSAVEVYERQLDSLQMRDAYDDIEDAARRLLEINPGHRQAKKWLKVIQQKRRRQS